MVASRAQIMQRWRPTAMQDGSGGNQDLSDDIDLFVQEQITYPATSASAEDDLFLAKQD
jgi:hypothetical protein